ncbi:Ribosomal protein S4/S9 [Gracilaria domingensis]|nr:Ribosomal protein S4/S9 [Gracilaria domingensis]
MRKLKYHEYKLLRKADFLKWKRESNLREVKVARRYHLSNPDEYHRYSKIVGDIKQLCSKLQELKPDDPTRVQRTEDLITKLYDMGIISIKSDLRECSKVTVSAVCRRRLPVVMKRLKFAENLTEAITLIEQGHIRVGPTEVKDPAMLVTRNMEDFITWVDTSKIKRKVSQFNDNLDDYDLLNA